MNIVSVSMLLWISGSAALYWLLPRRMQIPFMGCVTLLFLAIYSPFSALILLALTCSTYWIASNYNNKTGVIIGAIIALGGVFSIYKLKGPSMVDGLPNEVLALGISFYMLRATHYLVERYKGSLDEHRFMEFAGYMIFLPTLIVGPINRFGEFLRESHRHRWDPIQFSSGLERILYGYVKIVLLANYLVSVKLNYFISTLPDENEGLRAYLECIEYGLNLYFQFAGFSDVAIGFALLLGLRIGENFSHPFFQKNISAFWKSWHISLSSWCRDYIYMPVAAHLRSPYLAIVSSMLALGLWHEFSARYLLWGVYHGSGIVIWQLFQSVKPNKPATQNKWIELITKGVAITITFNFVMLGFAITKEPDLRSAVAIYRAIFHL